MKDIAPAVLSSRLLKLLNVPAAALTDVELRLIRIAVEFMLHAVIQVRCDGLTAGQQPRDLDAATMGRAAELAIAAAIAIEKPLRDVRDELEQRGLAS